MYCIKCNAAAKMKEVISIISGVRLYLEQIQNELRQLSNSAHESADMSNTL